VPANEPKRAPEFEYRVHVRSNSIGITPYLAETRTAVPPSDAFDMLGALPSPHRAILRLLADLHPKSARGAQVEARGENGAELVSRLRGKRVLVEPMLMELRYVDEPLVPRLELEMVPPTQVRVRAVFERKTSDSRRFQLSQGLWLEGEPGWHIDPIQGVARPLADFVTPVLLERLLKTQAINYPTSDVSRLLSEHLPKVCLALNAPLPDIRAIVDEVDEPPKFVLRAAGDLTRVVATLDVHYAAHEFLVPPVDLPPPLVILDTEGGRPKCLRRDIGAEHGAMRQLLDGGLEVTDDFRALQAEGENAIRFWSECVPSLPREWAKYVPEHLVNVKVRSAPVTPRARVSSGVDWLSVDVEFGSEGSRASEDDLRRALEMGSNLVRLEDGSYARLEGEQVRDVLLRMSEIYASGKSAQLPLSQAGRVQDLLDTLGQRAEVAKSTKDFFAALGEHKVEAVEPPKELNATMRPYQLEGFSWLAYLYRTGTGGILADDMGLGKTLQAIALLLWAKRLQQPAIDPDDSKRSKTAKPKKVAKAAKDAALEEDTEAAKLPKKTSKKAGKKTDEDASGPVAPVAAPEAVALEHSGPLALVIAPTSVVTNWVREVQKFAPNLSAIAWTGSDRSKYKADIEKADVIVTSYALLRRDEEFLKSIDWGFVILDEAQSIKNPTSATARAAKNLNGQRRLALTGTPIENRLSEIWSIFDFVSPGLLPTLSQFEERYARPIDRGDEEASRRLRSTIHPFVLRRTKGEVAKDLPEKIVTERLCELPPEQVTVYKTVLKTVRDSIYGEVEANGLARSQLQILAGLTRLRQAACDPRLLTIPGTYSDETSGKMVALKELIAEAQQGGHRTLVFSQFVSMLTLIRAMLDQEGIAYEYIDGDTKERQARVDRFNRDEKIPVFLISLKAGGTGLNLTGADTVVHFDPWWNPAVEDQATDRAHRIGQTRVVTAYRFVAKGTIEEKIIELSAKKRELVDSVLGHEQDEKVAGILTRAELDRLFADD
jgi:SNF2 family DNA or RNA helicase